jgi:hypothetical protein
MNRTAFTVASAFVSVVAFGCESTPPLSPTPTVTVGAATSGPSFGLVPPGGLHAHTSAAHSATAGTARNAPAVLRLTPESNQQLSDLRSFVAKFHNFDRAVEYGYSVAAPAPGVCISDPVRGGMGFHYTYAKEDLISDGKVELLKPEFLVYAPKPQGGVKFSALDYFVPYTTWSQAEPPSLLGVPFAREDGFQAYVLHIWLFWHNPAGMFENYNPDVPLC